MQKKSKTIFKVLLALAATAALVAAVLTAVLMWPRDIPAEDVVQQLDKTGQWTGQIILTEFADFNCGYCAEFAMSYTPRLREDFLYQEGITMQFRHYPFLDGSSWDAAMAYECAKDQEVEDTFHDLAFAQHLSANGPDFSHENLEQIAKAAGARLNTFNTCMRDETHRATVENDKAIGRKVGINGTPALFLNGEFLTYQGYNDISIAITTAIAEKNFHIKD